EGQISRLFEPLAYTKTTAMLASALLSITLVPVLLGVCLRKIKPPKKHPAYYHKLYCQILGYVFTHPKKILGLFVVFLIISIWPITQIKQEFMPPLDEGDWMYMPSMATGLSIDKAREVLQKAHRSIKQIPEVEEVFGKAGRINSATDIAPLTMIESFIKLKPKDQWRENLTTDDLKNELNQQVDIPGLTNAWVMPIKGRIDMLTTGIKTPLGLIIRGPNLYAIETTGRQIEQSLTSLSETASVYADKAMDARYIHLDIKRQQAARFHLSIKDIQTVIQVAVNGQKVTQIIEGDKRFSVKLKATKAFQSDLERLKTFPLITPAGKHLMLGDVVDIRIQHGPAMIKSDNARLQSLLFIEAGDVDHKTYIAKANTLLKTLDLPQGVSIEWAGQFQTFEAFKTKLLWLLPLILLVITLLLWFSLNNITAISIVLLSLPIGLAGSLWLLAAMDFSFSVAVIVGIIAMMGIAIETVMIMLMYLNDAWESLTSDGQSSPASLDSSQLKTALSQAATLRCRPLFMTVVADLAGLIPILLSTGTGSEIMQRLAAPMIGGLVTTLIMTLVLTPLLFFIVKEHLIKSYAINYAKKVQIN
ncbi:MAG: efflux RND transporter permease subunit, partial [Cellvibrionales bacterium]|nr:efflux RND transporter permease subunit [Cellvibrionales bacterium]